MPDLKHEIQLRLRAIELIALWEGRLITTQLTDWFGISRQQASADINRYITEINPGSLVHSPGLKGYVPADNFLPAVTMGLSSEYLALLEDHVGQPAVEVLDKHPYVAMVQHPDRATRPNTVREMVKACRNRSSLRIRYASMSHPELHERVISPHTLVHTGFRWHVRAWCHHRQGFRDFLLSRIDGTPEPCAEQAPCSTLDRDWQERVSVTLVPNQLLSIAQQALVERDFCLTEGCLQIIVRKALAYYTLQRYQAAITEDEAQQPYAHPLQLAPADRSILASYLFSGEASD